MEHRPGLPASKTTGSSASSRRIRQVPIVVGRPASQRESTSVQSATKAGPDHNVRGSVREKQDRSVCRSSPEDRRNRVAGVGASHSQLTSQKKRTLPRGDKTERPEKNLHARAKTRAKATTCMETAAMPGGSHRGHVFDEERGEELPVKGALAPLKSDYAQRSMRARCYQEHGASAVAPQVFGQASFFRQTQWAILAWIIAIGVSVSLFATKPAAKKVERKPLPPLVELKPIVKRDVSLMVKSQGVVSPTLSIPILSEVNGRVVWVSPEFGNGGFFQQGDKMVRIERTQYELDVARARSNLALAQRQLLRAEAEVAARQGVDGLETNELGSGESQVNQAQARLEAARAELRLAQVRLERTDVLAPFTGLVQEKRVGLGQVVAAGSPLGQLYSTDEVEVRLPLNDTQRKSINIPFQGQGLGSKVVLTAHLGQEQFRWSARIARAESQLNHRNRMLYVLANVKRPFDSDPEQPGRPPLSAGTFVDAAIFGDTLKDVWVVPRAALRSNDEVWVVTAQGTLKRQPVLVTHKDETNVYVSEGLDLVDRVIVTSLDVAIDGMAVRVVSNPEVSPARHAS